MPYVYSVLLAFWHGKKVTWKQTEEVRSRIRKQASPFVAALIELHKSQCFFMVSRHHLFTSPVVSKDQAEPETSD